MSIPRRSPAVAVVVLVATLAACGGGGARPSPTATPSPTQPASPAVSPSPSLPVSPSPSPSLPTPTPPVVAAGASAWVDVSVATVWRSPGSARAIDAPALDNPARIRQWLGALGDAGREGLIDRADTQVLLDDRVEVLSLDGAWAQVVVPDQATPLDARGYPGWMPVRQLTASAPPGAATTATVVVPTTVLTDQSGATLEVGFGTRLPVLASDAGTLTVGLPAGRHGAVAAGAVVVASTGAAPRPASAAEVLATARQFLGLPYLWAGTSGAGLDCSGLVYLVYRVHGVLLPRDAAPQSLAGRTVQAGALQPGDLVFFGDGDIHHVAIYAGGGTVLESPYTGAAVRIAPLTGFSVARRVLPERR